MLSVKKCLFVFFIANLIFIIKPALAENPSPQDTPWEKFNVNLGYFVSNSETELSIGAGLGITVNVEDLLGLDTTTNVFRADGSWRFTDNRRHRLDLTWFAFRRDGFRTVGQDFTIEDKEGNKIEIPAGSQVTSNLDIDIFRGGYSYSFFQDDRMDLAFSVGLYVMPIEIELNAFGLINVNRSESFTAPLPTLGLRADFAITPKWFLRTNFEIFYIEIGEFTGRLYESKVAVEYIPWKHLGFGLATDVFNFYMEADGEDYPGIDFKGDLDFKYTGLLLYAKMPF
jgi:hypothetical protein